MRKLIAAVFISLGLASAASAQQVSMPPPAGTIAILCAYNAVLPSVTTGQVAYAQCDSNGRLITSAGGGGASTVSIIPSADTTGAITSVVTGAAANNLVLKASAGNLYSVYATNLTSTAGFLAILNSTTSPADGAIAPLECAPLPANGNASINYNPGPAARFSTGITAVITSAATCFTKTTGVITGFIKGSVQ